MTAATSLRTLREERLVRRMVGRGEAGLAESLCALKGVTFGRRFVFRSLYAIGGEGAVFDVVDTLDPGTVPLVGKVPLHPVHRPFELTAEGIRERRAAMRRESVMLATCGSVWMPEDIGHYQFQNPALDARRGGVYSEAEPVLLMEKLPGLDLDRWLAGVHQRGLPPEILRRTLDRYCVALLQSVADMEERGFHYADLRPGNIRVIPQPVRRIRLLDAGSIVRNEERSQLFPHVPAYLPPQLFRHSAAGERIEVSVPVTAVMAGRSMFEIATGEPPFPGEVIDTARLAASPVSPPVAEVTRALAEGEVASVRAALDHLTSRAIRRVVQPEHRTKARIVETPAPQPQAPAASEGGRDWQPADFLSQGDVAMPEPPHQAPRTAQRPAASKPRAARAAPAAPARREPRAPASVAATPLPVTPAKARPSRLTTLRAWLGGLVDRLLRR